MQKVYFASLFSSVFFALLIMIGLAACGEADKQASLYFSVQRGDLPIYVTATGELDAKNSGQDPGPAGHAFGRGL